MNQFGIVLFGILVSIAWAGTSEEEGKKFIHEVDQKCKVISQEVMAKQWAADTADKAHREKAGKEYDEAYQKWDAYQKEVYPKIMSFPWKTFKDPNTKRMFFWESFLQETALPDDKKAKLEKVKQDINKIIDETLLKEYKSADNKPKLKSTDVDEKVKKDYKNVDEMNFYWKEKHDAIGKPVKNLFTQWVELESEAARLNGYKNVAEFWQAQYEIDNFENTMLQLYKRIEPLFKELHAYIRYKLWVVYGKKDNIVDPKGPISASLLGYKWGHNVASLYNLLEPYPHKPSLDISPQLKAKGYSAKQVAEIAEKFYVSLGLDKMPGDFWNKYIFEKKGDIDCSPQAYDFFNGKDYRMVLCTISTEDDFTETYVPVGYLKYMMAIKNLPYFFQQPPGTAFEVGFQNLMNKFASSPDYLKSLGLLDSKLQIDKELEINTLLREALEHVFNLPWLYTYDLWRWEVTEGKITPQKYNCEYWKMRTSLQGVEPPVDRDENDFDVGVNSWFSTGGQYIQYYIGEFIKCDMIRGLCKTAGYYNPKSKPNNALVFCNVNNNKAVGAKLKEIMSLGNSQPWYKVLEKLTGDKKLDGSALMEYYQPLYKWLQEENKKNKVTVGWNAGHNRCH